MELERLRRWIYKQQIKYIEKKDKIESERIEVKQPHTLDAFI